ncbi:S66 peptidase family protein [Erythrobacter mangrovi]|uniref:LD-carboxypeptidase n=1 Tax=Erythrobacter mangrovi TaxID=2739433 RepID=A0A7D4BBY3_9SPHN|nr:LD-carboxypeptidase [Erythrobacter mangrovi]QKG72361.1 LD-carboxypeptidase [Erythrobacter mangrovi]
MIDRRAALGGIGALAAFVALPAPGLAAASRKPPRLRLGDTVGLVAPASAVTLPDELDRAVYWIEAMGLVPKLGTHVTEQDGYLAGSDAARAADLNAMFADPEVRALFAVRGGWGGARVLELLDWSSICAHPKLLIGYSDTTALHLAIAARGGFPTIHGPNGASRWEKASWESLWRLAFTGEAPVLGGEAMEQVVGRPGRTITGGRASGRLLGGNLTIISTLMGTPWLPDFTGAVLFLEDVNEAEYRVDRMLLQLKLAGVLDALAGVVFGQCTRCSDSEPGAVGFTLDQVVDHHLAPLGIPTFAGANIGHITNQLCLPSGVRVELDADARTLRVLEPMVD